MIWPKDKRSSSNFPKLKTDFASMATGLSREKDWLIDWQRKWT